MDPNQYSNLAIIVSVVVALSSIFSSILTALLNNRHQQKLRLLELRDKATREQNEFIVRVFENYLSKTAQVISISSQSNVAEAGAACGAVLLYVTEEEAVLINQCYELLRKFQYDQAAPIFRNIAAGLRTKVRQGSAVGK